MSTQQTIPTVLAISGSLRKESLNTKLLKEAERFAPRCVRWIRFSGLGDLPHFNEDDEYRTPVSVLDLRSHVRQADGLLIASPEYNASVPGALKNAIDWLSRPDGDTASPLAGTPVAIIGASQGPLGTARAQMALRQILQKVNSVVVQQPEFMLPAAHTQLHGTTGLESGSMSADVLRQVIDQLLRLIDDLQLRRTSNNDFASAAAD
jgi:chromate reductase